MLSCSSRFIGYGTLYIIIYHVQCVLSNSKSDPIKLSEKGSSLLKKNEPGMLCYLHLAQSNRTSLKNPVSSLE